MSLFDRKNCTLLQKIIIVKFALTRDKTIFDFASLDGKICKRGSNMLKFFQYIRKCLPNGEYKNLEFFQIENLQIQLCNYLSIVCVPYYCVRALLISYILHYQTIFSH